MLFLFSKRKRLERGRLKFQLEKERKQYENIIDLIIREFKQYPYKYDYVYSINKEVFKESIGYEYVVTSEPFKRFEGLLKKMAKKEGEKVGVSFEYSDDCSKVLVSVYPYFDKTKEIMNKKILRVDKKINKGVA